MALLGALALLRSASVKTRGQLASVKATPDLTAADLRCEYVSNPPWCGCCCSPPFWKLESAKRDQRQIAYRILAAATAEALAMDHGDLWDAGKVVSDETIQISVSGQAVEIVPAGLLGSACLGQGRWSLGLEPAGVVDDGSAQGGRLAGPLDRGSG